MVIVVGGMIGLGKTTLAELLGKELKTEVFYEKVDDNRVLKQFYTASQEEVEQKRYPFLLQIEFLLSRFNSIKQALHNDNNILDRSIYEDKYFASRLHERGDISDLEYELYCDMFDTLMCEVEDIPKQRPDLMIYLRGSFDTVLDRIKQRGRDFEVDDDLVEYYKYIWEGYDEWVATQYNASPILVLNVDMLDWVNNPIDKEIVIGMINDKLNEL